MYKIRRLHLYSAIFIIVLLEFTALNRLIFLNVRPDLLLIAVLFFSLYYDRGTALEAGIAAGLIRDLLGTGTFGINTVLFGTIALFFSFCSDKIYKDFFLAQMLTTAAAVIFLYLTHLCLKLRAADTASPGFGEALLWVVLPAVLYTSLVSPFVFFALGLVFRVRKGA